MPDRRPSQPLPNVAPDGPLARADERRRVLERERLAIRREAPSLLRPFRWAVLCIVGAFLLWLELTFSWMTYAEEPVRKRNRIKGWVVAGGSVAALISSVTDHAEYVVPWLGIAGAFLLYLLLIDGAIALYGRWRGHC